MRIINSLLFCAVLLFQRLLVDCQDDQGYSQNIPKNPLIYSPASSQSSGSYETSQISTSIESTVGFVNQQQPEVNEEHHHHHHDPYDNPKAWDIRDSVPGEPGEDYPTHSFVPPTEFSCEDKPNGYYADIETGCQAFRICTGTPQPFSSVLCPNGSLFNQAVSACDWWNNVNCKASERYYPSNAVIAPTLSVSVMLQNVQNMVMAPVYSYPQYYQQNENMLLTNSIETNYPDSHVSETKSTAYLPPIQTTPLPVQQPRPTQAPPNITPPPQQFNPPNVSPKPVYLPPAPGFIPDSDVASTAIINTTPSISNDKNGYKTSVEVQEAEEIEFQPVDADDSALFGGGQSQISSFQPQVSNVQINSQVSMQGYNYQQPTLSRPVTPQQRPNLPRPNGGYKYSRPSTQPPQRGPLPQRPAPQRAQSRPSAPSTGYNYPRPRPSPQPTNPRPRPSPKPQPSPSVQPQRPRPTPGYNYPQPQPTQPRPRPSPQPSPQPTFQRPQPSVQPQQPVSTSGYNYPQPQPTQPRPRPSSQPSPQPTFQQPQPNPTVQIQQSSSSTGYNYQQPQPTQSGPQPTIQQPSVQPTFQQPQPSVQPQQPVSTPGYNYPQPQPTQPQPRPSPQPSPQPTFQQPQPNPTVQIQQPSSSTGYNYQQPTQSGPQPTIQQPSVQPTFQQPQPSVQPQQPVSTSGYNYPQPQPTQPRPSPSPQPSPQPTFQQPSPQPTFQQPSPQPTFQQPQPNPTVQIQQPSSSTGYNYQQPQPTQSGPQPTVQQPSVQPTLQQPQPNPSVQPQQPVSTSGYNYQQPTQSGPPSQPQESPQQAEQPAPTSGTLGPPGYNYPNPQQSTSSSSQTSIYSFSSPEPFKVSLNADTSPNVQTSNAGYPSAGAPVISPTYSPPLASSAPRFTEDAGNNEVNAQSSSSSSSSSSSGAQSSSSSSSSSSSGAVAVDIVSSVSFDFNTDEGKQQYVSAVLGGLFNEQADGGALDYSQSFLNADFDIGDINALGSLGSSGSRTSTFEGPSSYSAPQGSVEGLPSPADTSNNNGFEGYPRRRSSRRQKSRTSTRFSNFQTYF